MGNETTKDVKKGTSDGAAQDVQKGKCDGAAKSSKGKSDGAAKSKKSGEVADDDGDDAAHTIQGAWQKKEKAKKTTTDVQELEKAKSEVAAKKNKGAQAPHDD